MIYVITFGGFVQAYFYKSRHMSSCWGWLVGYHNLAKVDWAYLVGCICEKKACIGMCVTWISFACSNATQVGSLIFQKEFRETLQVHCNLYSWDITLTMNAFGGQFFLFFLRGFSQGTSCVILMVRLSLLLHHGFWVLSLHIFFLWGYVELVHYGYNFSFII